MRKTLQSLADIRAGYTFRGKVAHDVEGNVRVLQIKDIKGRHAVQGDSLPLFKLEDFGAAQSLTRGDIVLPARGEYYEATLYEGGANVVPTSQLWVLHVHSSLVTPDFLCWCLNQPTTQRHLTGSLAGSNIPMLSKQGLGTLSVSVPSLATQNEIVSLHQLWEREKQATQQLLENREKMLAGVFQRLLEA